MPKHLLYYLSPHGFGHARRAAEVIRAVNRIDPSAEVTVRAAVPARLYTSLRNVTVAPPEVAVDPGLAEHDALSIDRKGSVDRLACTLAEFERIVRAEAAFARNCGAGLVVSDVSFMAGHIAAEAGMPCIAISNFTWDWIYAALFGDDPRYAALAPRVELGYARMTRLLRLPFGGVFAHFGHVEEIPLVAAHPRCGRREVLDRLPPSAATAEARILIAQRGGIDPQAIIAAAAESPQFAFISLQALGTPAPPNLHAIDLTPECDFTDVLNVCDVAISKLGYGTISECIATGAALLWPRRVGFVEDAVSERQVPAYLRIHELPIDDLRGGRWRSHIRAVLNAPLPPRQMDTNGADVAARILLSM